VSFAVGGELMAAVAVHSRAVNKVRRTGCRCSIQCCCCQVLRAGRCLAVSYTGPAAAYRSPGYLVVVQFRSGPSAVSYYRGISSIFWRFVVGVKCCCNLQARRECPCVSGGRVGGRAGVRAHGAAWQALPHPLGCILVKPLAFVSSAMRAS
jgi:hypothetical protein